MKTDRFFYKTVNITQDIRWFFQTFQNFTGYDLIRRDQDIQVRTIDDYNNPSLIKTLMTTIVYIDKQVSNIQSNFVKLQSVIANVGGVFKIFTMAIAFVLYFVHSKHRLDALINYLFEFDRNLGKINIKDKFIQKVETQTEENNESEVKPKSQNFNRRTTKNSKIKKKNNENNSDKFEERIKYTRNTDSNNKKFIFELKSCSVLKNDIIETKSIEKPKKNILPIKFKYDLSAHSDFVTIWMLIKHNCCRNKVTKEESPSILLYHITSKILRKKSDIIYYFKLIDQFSIFKQIFLDTIQSKALNYISKQSVHFQYDSTKIEVKEIHEIIEYYREKIKNDSITDADLKILEGIEKRIIDEIFYQK